MSVLTPQQRSLQRTAIAAAALLVAAQVSSKATRDALFLGSWDVRWLPWAMLGAAGASLLAALVFTGLIRRAGPARTLPIFLSASALGYAAHWFLAGTAPRIVAWTLYFQTAIFGAVVISGFWSTYGELFDPNTSKKLIARVGGGATLGGLLGGLIAERLSTLVSAKDPLLLLGVLQGCAAVLALRFRNQTRRPPRDTQSSKTSVIGDAYLRRIAIMVTVTATGAALMDFAFKAQATQSFQGEQQLLSFFAMFYAATSLLSFVTQTTIAGRLLNRMGIGATLALLPTTIALFATLGTVFTRLPALILLRGSAAVLQVSTHRSSYELLYTPISAEKKRSAKTLIDVGFERLGDALGAGGVLLIVALLPLLAIKVSTALAGLLALAAVGLSWSLHRGYVQALAHSLKTGSLQAEKLSPSDATTKRTIAETTLGMDRDRLLQEISRFRAPQEAGARSQATESRTSQPDPEAHHLAQTVEELLSGDVDVIRKHLDDQSLSPRLTAFLLPQLAEPQLAVAAHRALLKLGPKVAGQLHDALLDAELSAKARRRIPKLLRALGDTRAVNALMDGLRLNRFGLRYRSGQALVELQTEAPPLVAPPEELIHELVLTELRSEGTQAARRSLSLPPPALDKEGDGSLDDENAGWLNENLRSRLELRLEHVFSLLSLVHDRNPLQLCLSALYSKDQDLRGTALEYLENVLPAEVRLALSPYLQLPADRESRPLRQKEEVLDELLQSAQSLSIDASLLKPLRER